MFDLSRLGERERAITQQAIDRCDYPFARLNRTIPVEWADLSRYAVAADAESTHFSVTDVDGDHGHGVAFRKRVLGLAWYSGKVSIERTLVDDPMLAQEVFLSEGAHMIDFFVMTDEERAKLMRVMDPAGDSHWFDDPMGYWHDVGEAFMGGFIKAYAPSVPVTITSFVHPATDEVGKAIREILTPELAGSPVFGIRRGKVYHDSHKGILPEIIWPNSSAAQREGRVPCRICKPR